MYRRKNYWPLLHFAAGLTGLVSLAGIVMAGIALANSESRWGGQDFWLFVLMMVSIIGIPGAACVGVFRKTWWGRGVMTFVSCLYLLAFPLGTILSIFVLRGLAEHKGEFRRKW